MKVNIKARMLILGATMGLGLVFASLAFGEATRTWVSGVGDDANPCSRTAPCKTFAGAISKTAAGGEIDVLDPGGFGAVTITKSITIDGSPGSIGSILSSNVNGVVVNDLGAGTIVVTLKNLSINGAGTTGGTPDGILVGSAKTVKVMHCQISNTWQHGIEWSTPLSTGRLIVTDTEIHDNLGRGISWNPTAGGKLFVTRSNIHSNGQRGIFFQPSAAGGSATVVDTTLENNSAGMSVDATTGPATAALRNVTIAGNTGNGLVALGGAKVAVLSSTFADNPANGITSTASTVYVCRSMITGNGTGVGGSSLLSCGDNLLDGNGTNGVFSGAAHVA